jgi:acyl-CoA hydrolase
MEIGIRVIAENIIEKTERHVMTCYITMVAVDDKGRPARVPNLKIRDDIEQRRYDAAALRREFRKEIERRSLKIRQNPVGRDG